MSNNKNIMYDPYNEAKEIFPITYEECVIGDMYTGINNIKNKLENNYYDKNAFTDAFNIDVSRKQVPEFLYLNIHPEPWEANNIPVINGLDGWVCHCVSNEFGGVERITKTMLLFKITQEIKEQGLLIQKGSFGMNKFCFSEPTLIARAIGDKKIKDEDEDISTGWELIRQNTYTEIEFDSFAQFYNGNVKVFYKDYDTLEFNGVPIKPLKTNSLTVPISSIVDNDNDIVNGKMHIMAQGFNNKVTCIRVMSGDGKHTKVETLSAQNESYRQSVTFFNNVISGIGNSFMKLAMKESKLMEWNIPLTKISFPSHIYPTEFNPEYTRFSVDGYVYTIIGTLAGGDESIPAQLGKGGTATNIPDIIDRKFTIEKLDRMIFGKTLQNLEFNMPNNAIIISSMAKVLKYELTCIEYDTAEDLL